MSLTTPLDTYSGKEYLGFAVSPSQDKIQIHGPCNLQVEKFLALADDHGRCCQVVRCPLEDNHAFTLSQKEAQIWQERMLSFTIAMIMTRVDKKIDIQMTACFLYGFMFRSKETYGYGT